MCQAGFPLEALSSKLTAFFFHNEDLIMSQRVLYIFTLPSTNSLRLLSYSYWPHFNMKPNIYYRPRLFSANDARENGAQGWCVIYNMHCMICLGNENTALF